MSRQLSLKNLWGGAGDQDKGSDAESNNY